MRIVRSLLVKHLHSRPEVRLIPGRRRKRCNRWIVTVGEDVQEIGTGDEEESWEGNFLGVHELVKSFFADGKVVLDLLELWEHILLGTEIKRFLLLVTVCQ